MEELHPVVRRARIDVGAVLGAAKDTQSSLPASLTLNLGVQYAGLKQMEAKIGGGRPRRAAWSLGQASIPILGILLKSVANYPDDVDPRLVQRCRSSVDHLSAALTNFAEGR